MTSATIPKRPNIMIVCTDQQRTDTLSCYGSVFTHTPGFDRISDDGYRFDRAYCSSAVCTPSRVSLLSGQYVSRHKVWSIGVNTGDDVKMIQHQLKNHGYQTGLIGKAHLEAYGAPPELSQESVEGFEKGYGDWVGPYYGFDHVRLALGHVNYGMTGHYGSWLRSTYSEDEIQQFKQLSPVSGIAKFGGEAYKSALPKEFHNSVWTANSVIDFLDARNESEPFFLFASFQDPHHPHALPASYPAPVTADSVPMPRYAKNELEDKPPHFKLAHEGALASSRFLGSDYPMLGQGHGADFRNIDEEAIREGRSHYYSMVSLVDEQLQRVWQALEERGLYEDTMIIVTSDHGELLGDHGLWMKGPFHYDQLIRVPLLVKPAKHEKREPIDPKSTTVSLVDIVPSCLASAGIASDDIPSDGVDLFSQEAIPERAAFIETTQDWHSLLCRSIVVGSWKLTWYSSEQFGELYNMDTDPFEIVNLWSHPAHQSMRSMLISRLLDFHVALHQSNKERISYA